MTICRKISNELYYTIKQIFDTNYNIIITRDLYILKIIHTLKLC